MARAELAVAGGVDTARSLRSTMRRGFYRMQFSRGRQQRFLEVLFRLLQDGVPAREILEMFCLGARDLVDAVVAGDVLQSLHQGRSLATALQPWFPAALGNALRISEHTQDFERNGAMLTALLAQQSSLIQDFLRRVALAASYLVVALLMYVFLATRFFPVMQDLRPEHQWDTVQQLVFRSGVLLSQYGLILAAAAPLLILLAVWLLRRWRFPEQARRSADRFFPFSLYRSLCAGRTLEHLGHLSAAGLTMREALEVLLQVEGAIPSLYLREMLQRLEKGHNLAVTMDVGYFPNEDMSTIALLSRHSSFDQVLQRMGRDARQNAGRRIGRAGMALQGILYLLTGLLLLGYVATVFAPGMTGG